PGSCWYSAENRTPSSVGARGLHPSRKSGPIESVDWPAQRTWCFGPHRDRGCLVLVILWNCFAYTMSLVFYRKNTHVSPGAVPATPSWYSAMMRFHSSTRGLSSVVLALSCS